MDASQSKVPKIQNQVHNDAIWRQLIQKEFQCARDWQSRWAFMTELEYPRRRSASSPTTSTTTPIPTMDLISTNSHSNSTSSSTFSSTFPVKSKFSESKGMQDVYSHGIKQCMRHTNPKEKYFFPPTSSTQYGWTWQTNFELDPYPNRSQGRQDTLKWWGGTRESMP